MLYTFRIHSNQFLKLHVLLEGIRHFGWGRCVCVWLGWGVCRISIFYHFLCRHLFHLFVPLTSLVSPCWVFIGFSQGKEMTLLLTESDWSALSKIKILVLQKNHSLSHFYLKDELLPGKLGKSVWGILCVNLNELSRPTTPSQRSCSLTC